MNAIVVYPHSRRLRFCWMNERNHGRTKMTVNARHNRTVEKEPRRVRSTPVSYVRYSRVFRSCVIRFFRIITVPCPRGGGGGVTYTGILTPRSFVFYPVERYINTVFYNLAADPRKPWVAARPVRRMNIEQRPRLKKKNVGIRITKKSLSVASLGMYEKRYESFNNLT